MKLKIDREADALYLSLGDAPAAESEEVAPGIIVDYYEQGRAVGIEMLHPSRRAAGADVHRTSGSTPSTSREGLAAGTWRGSRARLATSSRCAAFRGEENAARLTHLRPFHAVPQRRAQQHPPKLVDMLWAV